jgi:hypothetical protein
MYFHQGYSPPNPNGHFSTLITLSPKKLKLLRILDSRESTTVKTEIMAKMPTVTPRRDNTVLNRFIMRALQANLKLSTINFKSTTLFI